MDEPKLVLDLFCGAGGASMGLHQAWPKAKIVGVDIVVQPHYLWADKGFTFIKADAIEFLQDVAIRPDFIWASPPCQGYSHTNVINGYANTLARYPRLITKVRNLITTNFPGVPYCIENVVNAPLRNHIQLCGNMFPELNVFRHRWFECNFPVVEPYHEPHPNRLATKRASFFNGQDGSRISVVGHQFSVRKGSRAMNIYWMNREELAEAVPPAYSRYIAQQYLKG